MVTIRQLMVIVAFAGSIQSTTADEATEAVQALPVSRV